MDEAIYFGLTETEVGCYFSGRFTLGFEFVNVTMRRCYFFFRAFFEVFFFGGEFFELEVDEAVGLFDFIDYDVGRVVAEFSSSYFELLYIP